MGLERGLIERRVQNAIKVVQVLIVIEFCPTGLQKVLRVVLLNLFNFLAHPEKSSVSPIHWSKQKGLLRLGSQLQ